MTAWVDTGRFVREFVRDPLHTASVTPSSRALAAAMVRALPTAGAPVVVELGPGTGAFTRAIQERTGGRVRHVAVELNARWAQLLAERHPEVDVVQADARELPRLLADRAVAAVDAVVSGLPWVAYTPGPDGRGLHAVITEVLAPTGVFTQFGYTWTRWAPPARRQLADLRTHFAEVATSRTVWRNVPPAIVHEARRPVRVT
ncbi:phospholipid N-methyltransferase [Pseudonocardia hierapolitana]|uniref:Phospholipid N-methyltransferase n=1 Tax=Pseudonocardia hierapolitana TaxID=1128676 RepID=A0A561SKX5_9PSEU|nr:methyltransferase domain-containing protein [Pseudonocardia hierapolitana]TWF75518.1 phospholipid N-methyltransferase [Pseudonocardia hierapolitana]